MNRLALLVVVAAAAAPGPASAQYFPPCSVTVFTTVDAAQVDGYAFVVTGVVQGQSAPSTCKVSAGSSSAAPDLTSQCQRLAMLAMTKPGQYLLEVKSYGGLTSTAAYCKLTKVTP